MKRALGVAVLMALAPGPAAAQRPAGWDAFVPAFDAYAVRDSIVGASALVARHGQAGFRAFAYLNPATGAAVIAVFNTRNAVRQEESAAGFRAVRDAALELIAR